MATLGLAGALLLHAGCSSVAPCQNALVVNTERTEQIAKASFDLVMHIDDSDRGFWRTNAPAFHKFVNWLRQPQTVPLVPDVDIESEATLPRCLALLMTVDNVKLAYKDGLATSNDLATAVLTLQAAVNQAGAWLTIVTNRPPL
jgi:hypothetical protein